MSLRVFYMDGQEIDPAERVLLQEQRAKTRRKQEETKVALERIKQRISLTLNEYNEDSNGEDSESDIRVDFEHINDPVKLYELLSDSRMRAKYESRLTIVLVGMEQKSQAREEVLQSLDEFFQEHESKSEHALKEIMEEVETEGIEIQESTESFDCAMETTMKAATKLTSLATEIRQLLVTAAAFPDNKKGRKKLEKALVQAENQIQAMSVGIDSLKSALEKNQEEYNELQQTLDSKITAYTAICKTADEAKKENYTLKTELSIATATLKRNEEELNYLRNRNRQVQIQTTPRVVDDEKVKTLQQELETKQKSLQELQEKSVQCEKNLQQQMKVLKEENEKQVAELKTQYEEQIRTLATTNKQVTPKRIIHVVQQVEEVDNISKEDNAMKVTETSNEAVEDVEVQIETVEVVKEEVKHEVIEEVEEHIKAKKLEEPIKAKKLEELIETKKHKKAEKIEDIQEVKETEKVEETEEYKEVPLSDGESIVIATLQREHLEKENALKAEMAQMKESYEKTVSSLTENLSELQTKLDAIDVASDNHDKVQYANKIVEIQKQKEKLQKAVDSLTDEKGSLCQQNRLQETKITELEAIIKQLHKDAQALNHQLEQLQAKSVASHSTQWSDHGSPKLSVTLSRERSVVQMEEVFYQSGDLSVQSPTFSSDHELHIDNVDQLNASPLHVSQSHVPDKPTEFPALALSRLSRHSPSSTEILTLDHPIVQDWRKAYEQVMKFKGSVLELIESHSNMPNAMLHDLVQDLKIQGDFKMNEDQDIQGQVTQMRFTLSLSLHQLENALRESLMAVLPSANEGTLNQTDIESQFKLQIESLKERIQQSEERHQAELIDSQDTITNLSIKIESLKSEIVHLRHLLEQTNEGKVGAIFFTRLDAIRNDKSLQEIKISQQISEEEYRTVSSKMEDYVSIPGQQFQAIAQKLKQENQVKRTIASMQQHFSYSPEHTSRVINLIRRLEERRQTSFKRSMSDLSLKRLRLAENLQVILSQIEKETGVFLIKPIYPSKASTSLMIPLRRAPPSRAMSSARQSTPPSTAYKSVIESGQNTPHPTLRLINSIRVAAPSGQKNMDIIEYATVVPPPPPTVQPVSNENAPKWSVGNSRKSTPVSYTPVTPKLVELETCRLREPESLLKSLQQYKDARRPTPQSSLTLPPICIPNHHQEQSITN